MPGTIDLRQSDPVQAQIDDSVLCVLADDLQGRPSAATVADIRNACQQQGYFCARLSSTQAIAVTKALSQMEHFFSLPDTDPRKQASSRHDADSGWIPKGTEPAYQPGTVSSLEAFDFGKESLEGRDSLIWPALDNFRSDLAECWREYCRLGDDVLQALALAAGLPVSFLSERCRSRDLNTMRLLHYASEQDIDPRSNVGIAAHTDFECITLLYQTSAGLELLDALGNWHDAPAQDGKIIILLGDMLERWTNGEFKATGHRVRNTMEQRFSIVQFIAVDPGIAVSPLAQFISDATPAAYTAITQKQHIDEEVGRAEENARLTKPAA